MKPEDLHIGMKVRHPQYGVGTVKTIGEITAEIQFGDGRRPIAPETSGIEPAEPVATITGLQAPLKDVIRQTVEALADQLGVEKPEAVLPEMLKRWLGGKVVMHPADPAAATKEVPIDVFFHKIVMIRNNLRVLEQKINAHETLTEAEKIDIQQYITRSYGSLTTFNILFKEKESQF
jgi:hypothetical protein